MNRSLRSPDSAWAFGPLAEGTKLGDSIATGGAYLTVRTLAGKAAIGTDRVEFLRKQKFHENFKMVFVVNADEFLGFMSKTETDTGFGRFFYAKMFTWYSPQTEGRKVPGKPAG